MRVKDLTNKQLDHHVAKAQGWEYVPFNEPDYGTEDAHWVVGNKIVYMSASRYSPTTNWEQACELLVEFKLSLVFSDSYEGGDWLVIDGVNEMDRDEDGTECITIYQQHGVRADNPQRAICLTVVQSKFGDEIDDNN